jgi:hypothetical protein
MEKSDQRALIQAVLDVLSTRNAVLASSFTLHKTGSYAVTGGPAHLGIAYQVGGIADGGGSAHQLSRLPRLSVQLTLDAGSDPKAKFALLQERQHEIEARVGHSLTWLPGGDSGDAARAVIRSWHQIDASNAPGDMKRWAATEADLFAQVFASELSS